MFIIYCKYLQRIEKVGPPAIDQIENRGNRGNFVLKQQPPSSSSKNQDYILMEQISKMMTDERNNNFKGEFSTCLTEIIRLLIIFFVILLCRLLFFCF